MKRRTVVSCGPFEPKWEKFEQKETEFRRSDRKERATKLAVLAEADGDILPH